MMTPAELGAEPSRRESQVAIAMLFGRNREQTAADLFIEPCTVDVYRGRLYAKFGARNSNDLVRILMNRRTP